MLSAEDFQAEDRVFQMGNPPWRIDFFTTIDGVTFDQGWSGRQHWQVKNISVPVLSREHLIANKRTCGRAKDLADVQELGRPG
jgi:hypothetical protein